MSNVDSCHFLAKLCIVSGIYDSTAVRGFVGQCLTISSAVYHVALLDLPCYGSLVQRRCLNPVNDKYRRILLKGFWKLRVYLISGIDGI